MPIHTTRAVFFIALLLSSELSGGARTSFGKSGTANNRTSVPLPDHAGALVDVEWNRHGHHHHGHHHGHNNVVVVNPGHHNHGHHHHGHHHGHTDVVVVNPGHNNHGHHHHGHTDVVVVNPGHHHHGHHHHGPRPGAIFATAAAALAAGAVIAAATRPPKPPRGTKIVVLPPAQPVYMTSNNQRMMQVSVTAPEWCTPCSNEPIEIMMSGQIYYVTSPSSIWAGQTFIAYVPAPSVTPVVVPPPVIPEPGPVTATVISQGAVWTLQVLVPPPKGPGQQLQVRMPNGKIQSYQIPPGIFAGQSFQIQYNPTAEILNKILSKNKCCCYEDDICFWVHDSISAKMDGHCPSFYKVGENGFCAKKKCKPFEPCEKSKHTKSQHGRKCPAAINRAAFIRACEFN